MRLASGEDMRNLLSKSHEFYCKGDLVALRDSLLLMTVEAVRENPFGVSLYCCWFDGNDCLQFSEYPATHLDLYPREFSDPDIRIGTELRLRSRGPVMTVINIEMIGTEAYALCEWTGPNDRPRRREFPVRGLVLSILDQLDTFDIPLEER